MIYILAATSMEATAIAAHMNVPLRAQRREAIWLNRMQLLQGVRFADEDKLVEATNWRPRLASQREYEEWMHLIFSAALTAPGCQHMMFDVDALQMAPRPPQDLNDLEAVENWLQA